MRGRGAKGKLLRTILLFTILFIAVEINIFIIADAEYISYKNNQEYITVVDKSGGGDYTTIQEAINNAPEDSTIYVKIGTYNEIININKKIILIGESKDKTIINPISEENKYAIRVGAPQVTIKNLSITNRGPGLYTTGIKIVAAKTQIEDCNIYDTPVGIAIWTSNNIINNCNFWGCKDEGIALIGAPYSNCENNKISNCKFYENCDGIELQYSSSNIITDCEFYENTHTGIDAIASSNDGNTISNCKIYNNEVHGIYLSSSSDNQMIDCTMSNNNDGNIVMDEDSHNNEIKNSDSNTDHEEDNIRGRLVNFLRLFQKRFLKFRSVSEFAISSYQNLHFW
jgi:parallel beta-helix repeat protein